MLIMMTPRITHIYGYMAVLNDAVRDPSVPEEIFKGHWQLFLKKNREEKRENLPSLDVNFVKKIMKRLENTLFQMSEEEFVQIKDAMSSQCQFKGLEELLADVEMKRKDGGF